MFYGCLSLSSLPNISKWNINNDIRMENILNECPNLLIPKIIKIKFNL